MRKLFFIGLFLCGLISGVKSQNYQYSTRNYAVVDGLPQSQISGLVEDGNGYLWMGTFGGGIARFDGRDFKAYTTRDGLLSNDTRSILIDKKENIWILHPKGVTKFDGLAFKKFEVLDSVGSKTGFRRMYLQGDTIFLISTTGSKSKIHNDSLYSSEKPHTFRKKMMLHLTQKDEACFLLEDGSFWIETGKENFLIPPVVDVESISTVFNYGNDVLVQTESGLLLLDIHNRRLKKTSLGFELKNVVIFYDHKREVFWTINGGKLFKETFRNGILTCDTVLKDVGIKEILIDSEDNTWIATDGRGLYKYFIQDFDRYDSDKIEGVMSILEDDQDVRWIGTMNRGIIRIKEGKTFSYTDTKNVFRNSIHAIKQAPDGTIWVGAGAGLARYNESKNAFDWITLSDKAPIHSVVNIDFDDSGVMWLATTHGIIKVDNEKVTRFTTKDGLNSDFTWSVLYSKNHKTLFAGSDQGLEKKENGSARFSVVKEFSNTCIISLNTYRDSLLLLGAAGTGLIVYNPATQRYWSVTTEEGLASDFIYFVAPDEKDYVWIGTEKGINRIKFNSKFEVIENLHYGYDNGLLGVETNQNASQFTSTGKYFGLVDGLYTFNDINRKQKNPFKLHLTDVKILYGEYSARDYTDSVYSFFKIPFHPYLPTDRNHVTFTFNRVDKRYPKSVKFRYFLENFDKAWSLPSSTGEVTYGNLPPGDYIFRVMATDDRGSWSDDRIAYSFRVQSPFYLQATFLIGLFIVIAGIITLILYIRVRQRIRKAIQHERIRTKEQESLRKEIARDFHDEMGNQLTRIINYVSLLKLNGQSGYSHEELYGKVETSAKYLYSGTRDFIWSIDPVNDELCKLFIYIRDFGEKLFEEKGIQFRAFNDIKEKLKLPYGFSREANLIFKEAMTNAFKYSEAENVTLSLSKRDENFELIFDDDGKGFYIGDVENSNGLKNIRERADKINAVLRINAEENKGVRITLQFKLTKTIKHGLTF